MCIPPPVSPGRTSRGREHGGNWPSAWSAEDPVCLSSQESQIPLQVLLTPHRVPGCVQTLTRVLGAGFLAPAVQGAEASSPAWQAEDRGEVGEQASDLIWELRAGRQLSGSLRSPQRSPGRQQGAGRGLHAQLWPVSSMSHVQWVPWSFHSHSRQAEGRDAPQQRKRRLRMGVPGGACVGKAGFPSAPARRGGPGVSSWGWPTGWDAQGSTGQAWRTVPKFPGALGPVLSPRPVLPVLWLMRPDRGPEVAGRCRRCPA